MSECAKHPIHVFRPCLEHDPCVLRTHHEYQGGPVVEKDHIGGNKAVVSPELKDAPDRMSPAMKVALAALAVSLIELGREIIVGF